MSENIVNYPYSSDLGRRLIRASKWCTPVQLRNGRENEHLDHRWEIISANPIEQLCWTNAKDIENAENLTDIVSQATHRHTSNDFGKFDFLPFCSGAIGLVTYDAGAILLDVDPLAGEDRQHCWPDVLVGIYQWSLVLDHHNQHCWLAIDSKMSSLESTTIRGIMDELTNTTGLNTPAKAFALSSSWQGSFDLSCYQIAFDKLQAYLAAGDCYQANLTTQYKASYVGCEYEATTACWKNSPAPFESYLSYQGMTVASCSPERFIKIHDGIVSTHPIKGTRPRNCDPNIDKKLVTELTDSEKDRAENVMIVDLMRNDLGRYCDTGTISVPRLFDIESYSNVHHLVSEVSGRITANDLRASLELYFGCAPGGSITGAPKKRAVEVIAELERHQRSIYCGSVFYLNNNGNLDSNILIRSLLFEPDVNKAPLEEKDLTTTGTVYCWGGGGIVADSEYQKEWLESSIKIDNLLKTLAAPKLSPH